jgi:hypothetical protein
VTLANAGHMPPYLNGKELPMEGAMLRQATTASEAATAAQEFGQQDDISELFEC